MNNLHHSRRWWSACKARSRAALVALGAATLAACGSGGGLSGASPGGIAAPTSCSANCGAAVVSLTDAPGDFLSYIVKVVSLQLTRSDGTVVQTIPVATTVDFAQLVNLSEIVSSSQIPAGNYTSASMTLDYASATIVVDNGTTGVTIAAGSIMDGSTSPPKPLQAPNSQMTVSLTLPVERAARHHARQDRAPCLGLQSRRVQYDHPAGDQSDDGDCESGVDRQSRARPDEAVPRARRVRERRYDCEFVRRQRRTLRESKW